MWHMVHVCLLSCFSYVRLFVTQWTEALQTPLSMRFFRQEYWSGLPCPPPGDLPDPGIELTSLRSPSLAGGFFTTSATWETCGIWYCWSKLFIPSLLVKCFPGCSAGKKSTCNAGGPGLIPRLGRSAGEGIGLPTPVFFGFPGGSGGKESACSLGDLSFIPGMWSFPREGNGYPL